MIELSDLMPGNIGKIFKIDDNLEVKRRLLDIGFTKDSVLECVFKSPFGGPVAYKIKNTVVALRKGDASRILVEKIG